MTPETVRWANIMLAKVDKLEEIKNDMGLQSIYEIKAYLDDEDESRVCFKNVDSWRTSLTDAMVWWIDKNIKAIKTELANTGITFEGEAADES